MRSLGQPTISWTSTLCSMNVLAPQKVSMATSAASRPTAIGTSGRPGLLGSGIDVVPGPAQVDLNVAVEVGRLESQGIAGDIPGRDLEGTAEGDDQVGEVAADADPLGRRIERRGQGVGGPVSIFDVLPDPIGDAPDRSAAGGRCPNSPRAMRASWSDSQYREGSV